ncbi:MAG TPA: hypothetical protein ACHBZ9_15225 [Arsenophonus nasoniae]|uniref:hypothetical protein n=1 Tax=Arsenophonus nasoniae TaxID=638 RepID=UPI00387A701E
MNNFSPKKDNKFSNEGIYNFSNKDQKLVVIPLEDYNYTIKHSHGDNVMDKRIEKIENRVDSIESTLSKINETMLKLDNKIDLQTSKLESVLNLQTNKLESAISLQKSELKASIDKQEAIIETKLKDVRLSIILWILSIPSIALTLYKFYEVIATK